MSATSEPFDQPSSLGVIRGTITRQLTAAQVGVSGFKVPFTATCSRSISSSAPTLARPDLRCKGRRHVRSHRRRHRRRWRVDQGHGQDDRHRRHRCGDAVTVDVASVRTFVDDVSYEGYVRMRPAAG
jgi:hypothetical protein